MSAPTNHWKLGLFVGGTVLIGLGALAYLAARTLQRETVSYQSYFDEGVTGLENGSPVSFRGVKIGSVSSIDVAPDRRHVEITYQLGVSALKRLGIASGEGKKIKISLPPELRVQIGSTGFTGSKYLQIDFFDAAKHPPPKLPFPVPENSIPSMPSTMDAVYRAWKSSRTSPERPERRSSRSTSSWPRCAPGTCPTRPRRPSRASTGPWPSSSGSWSR
jgi:MlaD protein